MRPPMAEFSVYLLLFVVLALQIAPASFFLWDTQAENDQHHADQDGADVWNAKASY